MIEGRSVTPPRKDPPPPPTGWAWVWSLFCLHDPARLVTGIWYCTRCNRRTDNPEAWGFDMRVSRSCSAALRQKGT